MDCLYDTSQMDHLLSLLQDYLNNNLSTEDLQEQFMSYYFNEGVHNEVEDTKREAMEGIVLALGITNDTPDPEDNFPSYITSEKLRYVIEENLPLLQ